MGKKKRPKHRKKASGLQRWPGMMERWKQDLLERNNFKKLVANIVICTVLALVLHFWLFQTEWGEEKLNKIIDLLFIEREASEHLAKVLPDSPYVFVEVNDECYREWNAPLITPRDQIAEAVKTAYRGGARVIFIDFLLEHPDSSSEGDTILRKVFETIANEHGKTSIVLPARLHSDNSLRKTMYDQLIDESPVFYRAVPKSVVSNPKENVARYWRECETYQSDQGSQIIWGASVLIAALMEGKIQDLEQIGEQILYETRDSYELTLTAKNRVTIRREQVDPISNRIRFSILPPAVDRVGNLNVKARVDIREIAYYASDPGFFKDKIVFIGNTSQDQGDLHLTPVGEMPGMYLIANAVETLSGGDQLRRSSWWGSLFWDAVVICIASVAFLYGFEVLVTLIFGFVFYVFAYVAFRHFDVFPISIMLIAAIGLFKIVDGVRETFAGVGKVVEFGKQLRRKG